MVVARFRILGTLAVLDTFADHIGEQLGDDGGGKCPGCEDKAVDPYGEGGKIGAIGALFKLELTSHGYTFVAKGVQSGHRSRLLHEERVYKQLEQLQRKVIPVYLGLVDVRDPRGGYALPGGADISHMLLLSWAGEDCDGALDWDAQIGRSTKEIVRMGVSHNDLRWPNLLWNEERQRVMVIDFDRATILPPAPHKRVAKLAQQEKRKHKRMARERVKRRM